MQFTEYPPKEWKEMLPEASDAARDLASKLVTYESGQRMRAADVSCLPTSQLTVIQPQSLINYVVGSEACIFSRCTAEVKYRLIEFPMFRPACR